MLDRITSQSTLVRSHRDRNRSDRNHAGHHDDNRDEHSSGCFKAASHVSRQEAGRESAPVSEWAQAWASGWAPELELAWASAQGLAWEPVPASASARVWELAKESVSAV